MILGTLMVLDDIVNKNTSKTQRGYLIMDWVDQPVKMSVTTGNGVAIREMGFRRFLHISWGLLFDSINKLQYSEMATDARESMGIYFVPRQFNKSQY